MNGITTVLQSPPIARSVTHRAPVAPCVKTDELSHLILNSDPAAAAQMYDRYAAGIRFYLRRAQVTTSIDETVYRILLRALRTLRTQDSITTLDIQNAVLESAKAETRNATHIRARQSTGSNLSLQTQVHLMSKLFTGLSLIEREILLRSYVLFQHDSLITREMQLTKDFVAQVRFTTCQQFKALTAENGRLTIN